jgi:hypothetical protein
LEPPARFAAKMFATRFTFERMMENVLVVTGVLGFLGIAVSAGAMESCSSKWKNLFGALMCLCVVLWLGSVVLMLVFSPGLVSSTPDPRF